MADHANASIPLEIREQFQRDEKGRILFFTAPPLNVEQPLTKDGRALGHSARYLAAKAKKEALKASKRKAGEANVDVEAPVGGAGGGAAGRGAGVGRGGKYMGFFPR